MLLSVVCTLCETAAIIRNQIQLVEPITDDYNNVVLLNPGFQLSGNGGFHKCPFRFVFHSACSKVYKQVIQESCPKEGEERYFPFLLVKFLKNFNITEVLSS